MSDDRRSEARQAMAHARAQIEARYPGINEAEAIAYARGFVRGMQAHAAHASVALGEQSARDLAFLFAREDKMLDAGGAYMGHAIIEAMLKEKP